MNCTDMQTNLDLYIDGELNPAEAEAISRHLGSCPECEAVRINRIALRTRLRHAARDVEIPPYLGERLRRSVFEKPTWGFHYLRPVMSLAAALLLAVGGFYYYFSPSPAKPVQTAASHLAPIMNVGLSQHVHCAVLRHYPDISPTLLELAKAPGANAGLVNAVESHAPELCHVVMAHQCYYNNRTYTHVVARGNGHLMSLLITKKGEGESFDRDLKAVASELGTPLFAANAQNYSIDAFETSGYLVYLVSDFDPAENLKTLESMTREVRAALL